MFEELSNIIKIFLNIIKGMKKTRIWKQRTCTLLNKNK